MSLIWRAGTGGERRSTVRLPAYVLDQIAAAGLGVSVDEDSAMRHDAVWACITRIAQDVSMMPADVVRYTGGRRVEVSPVPQIVAAPSVFVDAMDWRYQVVVSWLSSGNAWGIVTQTSPDARYPTRIELQSPRDVSWSDVDGELSFMVRGVRHDLWPVGDLWHVPSYTMPGSMLGLSPIAYHALTVRGGLLAEQFSVDFFAGGGHPHTVLAPERDPGPEGASRLKDAFLKATRGRDVAVLPQSVKLHQIQINPQDSQFIDAQRYSVEQVCRVFGEDPADYGASAGGTALTYANRSDADVARLKRRQFWITKLQNALTAAIPRPQVVKLNVGAFLMMTAEERHRIHDLRLRNRTRSVNEVRVLEDEEPFPGGEFDEPGIPAAGIDLPQQYDPDELGKAS